MYIYVLAGQPGIDMCGYMYVHIYKYREVRSLLSSRLMGWGGLEEELYRRVRNNLSFFGTPWGDNRPGQVLNNRPRRVGEAHTCAGKVIDKGSGDQFKSYTSPR
jgi:hypothetical protein